MNRTSQNQNDPLAKNNGTPPQYAIVKSPVDELMLITDGSALTGVYFVGQNHIPAASKDGLLHPEQPVLLSAAQQLLEYFAGTRKVFSVPIRFCGTAFQQNIWEGIAAIPYGETISYSELAKHAGAPQAIRAAGTATGRNPLSIIVPCHRVMGKNGGICGFAGGLDRKRYLLALENAKLAIVDRLPMKSENRQLKIF